MALKLKDFKKQIDDFSDDPVKVAAFEKGILKAEENLQRMFGRLSKIKDINSFISGIITKYESKKYREYWLKKGHYEVPTPLYWDLYRYAQEYGRIPNNNELRSLDTYGDNVVILGNYCIELINGQGSYINIFKIKQNDNEK